MRSSIFARIPGFRQRIIPEPRVPSRGSQARGTRLRPTINEESDCLREKICDGEGTNSPRLFTPGETKALAKSKVHQLSRAWVTNDVGWVVILTDLKNMADCHE